MKLPHLLVSLCLYACTQAHASVTCTLQSVYGSITYGMLDGSNSGNIYTGVVQFDKFDSFCCDPLRDVFFGQTLTYEVRSAAGLTGSDTIARVISEYDASNHTLNDAAATQWAIWKIVQDGSETSFSTGKVRILEDATLSSLATQYLTNAHNYSPADIVVYHNDTYQDQVVKDSVAAAQFRPQVAPVVVPEPSAPLLAALAGLSVFRRRRAK